jgi:hypothetical protein
LITVQKRRYVTSGEIKPDMGGEISNYMMKTNKRYKQSKEKCDSLFGSLNEKKIIFAYYGALVGQLGVAWDFYCQLTLSVSVSFSVSVSVSFSLSLSLSLSVSLSKSFFPI